MAPGFSFGFVNDDVDEPGQDADMSGTETGPTTVEVSPSLIAPQNHSLDEILNALPASLSYVYHDLPDSGIALGLPRRELYDIRAQLMSETDPSVNDSHSDIAAGLTAGDIAPGIYEGGFKTWECAADLARFVLQAARADTTSAAPSAAATACGPLDVASRPLHIIELGAGTALPTSALLHHLLTRPGSASPVTFTAADYNASVLTLATGPNLILTALAALDLLLPAATPHADIEPSPALAAALRAGLHARRVALTFLSGAWGPDFVAQALPLVPAADDASASGKAPLTLVLASETVYAPAVLPAFVETVLALLRAARARGGTGRALLAAKRLYFGVGGGVMELQRVVEQCGGWMVEVWDAAARRSGGERGSGVGVGRCIVEVGLKG